MMTCSFREHNETTLRNHICFVGFHNTPIIKSRILKRFEWNRWNKTMSDVKDSNHSYLLSGDIMSSCRVIIRGAKTSLATSLKEKEEE